ncbi:acetyltransferase [Poronia punctata]|nr:acetyltransferase [Poronia punctata]
MSVKPVFHIRGPIEGLDAVQVAIDSYDASLPRLAALGSNDQWGTKTFLERPNHKDMLSMWDQAKRFQTTGEGKPFWIFTAEVEIPPSAAHDLPASVHIRTGEDGKTYLAVGSITLSEARFPEYLRQLFGKAEVKEALDGTTDFLYVEGLFTDPRAGSWSKGAGAALIQHARRLTAETGHRALHCDSFGGNDRKLIKYYESQGFSVVAEQELVKPDGTKWPAAFYCMDVTK